MMRRAPRPARPTLRGFSASYRWTSEGDLVLSVHDAGPQVLSVKVSWRVWKRPAFVQLAQDRQHSGAKPAGIGQTPKPPAADQLQALAFIQALQHPRPVLRMVRRATAARTRAGGVAGQ